MQFKGMGGVSRKRILIDRANSSIFALLAFTTFITVACLVVSKNLLAQNSYQQKVIGEREKSLKQLKANVSAANNLVVAYKALDAAPESVIGTKDKNAKIILDALPSKYDFPALATSLEKILVSGGYTIESITGSDQETSAEQNSASPQPIEIPFQIGARGNYAAIQKLVADFERSIRPFVISTVELSGSDAAVKIGIEAKTFYQPEKNLDIQTKVVK